MLPTFIRAATDEDKASVAYRLRKADADEVLAASGLDKWAYAHALKRSTGVLAGGLVGGRAEVLFGCSPAPGNPDVGIIWLLGTDAILEHPREFHAACLKVIPQFEAQHTILTNFIDARNEVHIRWLKRLGFLMLRRIEKFGPHSLPFIEFAKPCASNL